MDFLQKHPTPWRLERAVTKGTRAGYETIVDAKNQEVIATIDGERYQSWLLGDVHELIDWVNTLGGSK